MKKRLPVPGSLFLLGRCRKQGYSATGRKNQAVHRLYPLLYQLLLYLWQDGFSWFTPHEFKRSMASLRRKFFLNVSSGEFLSWLLYVFFWGTFFYFVLIISYHPTDKTRYLYINMIDAAIKITLTIPLWWLFIVKLANVSLKTKLLLHFIALPLFCFLWVNSYGPLITNLHLSVFDMSTSMWDVYITALFYCSEFAIFHGYNYWLRSKRQYIREQELMELSYQSEIKALKAQIEPHFLFNTLNSISASVPPSLEETRVLIAQLADTFRYALKVSERPVVPLEEEMDFVRTWLTLEKHRFGNRLHIIYDIDPETLAIPVPPMILQPLLENALNHGISPLVAGGTVTVSCKAESNHVRISITDTGIGFDGPLETLFERGVGLSNTSRRLERLFGEPLTILRNEHGMSFSFRIPIAYRSAVAGASAKAPAQSIPAIPPVLPAQ